MERSYDEQDKREFFLKEVFQIVIKFAVCSLRGQYLNCIILLGEFSK